MHVDVQLATGRTFDVVTQVETIAPYGVKISDDYRRYTAGMAILETAERLTAEEREPAVQHYVLLVGALRTLAGAAHDPGLILDSYLLRGLSVAGFAPNFVDCARCGRAGPHRLFSVPAGGMVCTLCRPAGTVAPTPDTVALLTALLTGDWEVADMSQPMARRQASGITAAFLQWHIERGLRSLKLVERT
jgi:DNA repair protein RecO (recombination protein O)